MRLLLSVMLTLVLASNVWAANNFQRSPWILDSTGPTPISGGIVILSIIWTGIGSTGDKFILWDTTGREVLNLSASGGEKQFLLNLPIYTTKGLVVNTLSSGKVYLYFK